MEIIFITGCEDYDALTFEEEFKADIKTWNEVKKTGLVNDLIEAKALEFEEVDEKFIRFIEDEFIDYDTAKTKNFYIVKE